MKFTKRYLFMFIFNLKVNSKEIIWIWHHWNPFNSTYKRHFWIQRSMSLLTILLWKTSWNNNWLKLVMINKMGYFCEYEMKLIITVWLQIITIFQERLIKGILWDRKWIAPSIGIFSHACGFVLQKCIYTHETKQSSKF